MINDNSATLALMASNERERKRFAHAYENSPSGQFWEQQRASAAAQFDRFESVSPVKRLADEIQASTPGIRLDVAYALAAKKMGLLQ